MHAVTHPGLPDSGTNAGNRITLGVRFPRAAANGELSAGSCTLRIIPTSADPGLPVGRNPAGD